MTNDRWSTLLCQSFERLSGVARGPFAALVRAGFLGLMDNNDLARLTLRSYSTVDNGFEDQDFNLNGFKDDDAMLHTAAFPAGSRLLVVGCAGGRELIGLSRLGYDVVGIDPSEVLVEAARRNCEAAGVSAEVHVAPDNLFPNDLGVFDGILVGRGVYHHVPGSADRVALLKQCRDLTTGGQPIVVRGIVTRRANTHRWPQHISNTIRRLRRAEPVEPGDSIGANSYFFRSTKASMSNELDAAGFHLDQWRAPTAATALADAVGTAAD